jgi:hypothetical protein
MREFQQGREGMAGASAPVANQAGPPPEQSKGARQSSGSPGRSGASAGSSSAPPWAALLQPTGAAEDDLAAASPLPAAPQLAANAPGLGKTQAGNILASLASHSAAPAAAPATPSTASATPARAAPVASSAKAPGQSSQVGRLGPAAKASSSPSSTLSGTAGARGAFPGSTTANPMPVDSTPGLAPVSPSPAGPRTAGAGPTGPGPAGAGVSASGGGSLPTANGAANVGAYAGTPRTPSAPDESADADPHDDDILPSKPRASLRMRVPSLSSLRVQVPKASKQPEGASAPRSDASAPASGGKPSLGEWANGVSHRLSDRLRACSRGRGSS